MKGKSALDNLKEKYARGEIIKDKFKEIKTRWFEYKFEKIKNIWFLIASLTYIAAFGFIIAYFISGYSPSIAIAVMWACIGGLEVILGIHAGEMKNK